MKKEETKIFIIVPTYNGGNDIPAFFDTLKATTPLDRISVVAVDNASSDSTTALILSHFPETILIHNKENRGYAGGCNQGMEYALSHGAEYVFLTNQDVRFSKHWLEPLLTMMEKEKKLGAVQSLILMDQEKDAINSCGNALHYLGFGYTRGYRKKKNEWHCETTMKIGYTSGAGVLLRASALQTVGLFDDTYFMYHEDSDLCWRMRLAGYEVAVCADSIVYHHYEFSRSIQKFAWIEQNRIMNLFKNYHIRTLILLMPIFLFWEVGMIAYSFFGSLFMKKTIGIKEKLKGYAHFLHSGTWKHIRSERKKIAAFRRVPDAHLTHYMESTIEFQDISNPLITYIANPVTKAYWLVIKHIL